MLLNAYDSNILTKAVKCLVSACWLTVIPYCITIKIPGIIPFQCQKIFIYGFIPGILIVTQYGITVNQQALTKHLTAFVKIFESYAFNSILASTH